MSRRTSCPECDKPEGWCSCDDGAFLGSCNIILREKTTGGKDICNGNDAKEEKKQ